MTTPRILPTALAIAMLLTATAPGSSQTVAPPPQIPYGPPITLEQAKKAMAGAEAEAKKNNWGQVIAVLDSGGHVVILQRLDGAQLGSIEAAKDKAYSAVLFRRPTKIFQTQLSQGGNNLRLLKLTGSNPVEGGIPVVVDGKIVGAIGVSGALVEQDSQTAKAGADAVTN
jgi:uncharacterized protein GlcG (DUF336 family)